MYVPSGKSARIAGLKKKSSPVGLDLRITSRREASLVICSVRLDDEPIYLKYVLACAQFIPSGCACWSPNFFLSPVQSWVQNRGHCNLAMKSPRARMLR